MIFPLVFLKWRSWKMDTQLEKAKNPMLWSYLVSNTH